MLMNAVNHHHLVTVLMDVEIQLEATYAYVTVAINCLEGVVLVSSSESYYHLDL